MRNKNRLSIITITLGIIFVLSSISNYNIIDDQMNDDRSMEIRDETNLKRPKTSGSWTFSEIHIDESGASGNGTWAWAVGESWCNLVDGVYVIENITIDAGGSGSGIIIGNSSVYFIIRNVTVYNAGSGPYDAGIKLENTNNGTLINNNCSNNAENGILLYNDSDNNTISGNNASNNAYGIRLEAGCDNNTISGNNASENGESGIMLGWFSSNNIITGNSVNDNTDAGIDLDENCDNNTISGNSASYIGNSNQEFGIYLYASHNNTISGNTVNNNTDIGICLEDSFNNTISGNIANNNGDSGIYLVDQSNSSTITGNIVNNNIVYGIYLEVSVNNSTISGNHIFFNGVGIQIENGNDYNTIYLNSFRNNTNHAIDNGANNMWDNGVIGNYWDNHTSPDSDKNGIVDDPYTWITGTSGSNDSFPLTESPVHEGEKIQIDDTGVSAWTWDNTAKLKVWCTGSGTYSAPYVIDGLEIDGGGTGSGIIIGNSSVYFIIRNVKVYNAGSTQWDAGIKLENTNNGTLINNNCSDNRKSGILLYNDSDNNTISGNTASVTGPSFQDYGIQLYKGCDNNTISGNTVNNNADGIYLEDFSSNNIITGNNANDNSETGITLYDNCDNNTVSGNNVSYVGNTDQNIGIFLYGSDNNTISGNTANNNTSYGIYVEEPSYNNMISGNTANNNGDTGIYFIGLCDGSTITGNTVNYNTINGIYIEYAINFTISGNIINYNTLAGIYLHDYNDNNTIRGNNIFFNGVGIQIENGNDYNTIYLNYFRDNTKHAVDDGTGNKWDNGVIGNYWDNYTGSDPDGDGIGNTPHPIPGSAGATDTKPIVEIPARPRGLAAKNNDDDDDDDDAGAIVVIVVVVIIACVGAGAVVMIILIKKGIIVFPKSR